jgi:hypothetical protein
VHADLAIEVEAFTIAGFAAKHIDDVNMKGMINKFNFNDMQIPISKQEITRERRKFLRHHISKYILRYIFLSIRYYSYEAAFR